MSDKGPAVHAPAQPMKTSGPGLAPPPAGGPTGLAPLATAPTPLTPVMGYAGGPKAMPMTPMAPMGAYAPPTPMGAYATAPAPAPAPGGINMGQGVNVAVKTKDAGNEANLPTACAVIFIFLFPPLGMMMFRHGSCSDPYVVATCCLTPAWPLAIAFGLWVFFGFTL